MALPEGYLPREGDVVVLHAVVQYDVVPKEDASDSDGLLKVFVRLIGGYTDHRVPVNTLIGIYSRRFDVEERVRVTSQPELTGVVLSVYEDKVWVKFDKDDFGLRTLDATSLEPVPDPVDEPFVEPPPAPPMRFPSRTS